MLAEFSCPAGRRRFFYGEHLERMKRRSSASVSDGSGLSDSESECPSVRPSVRAGCAGPGGGGRQGSDAPERVLNQHVTFFEGDKDSGAGSRLFL